MAATAAAAVESIVGLDEIHVSGNVWALDGDHVHALAGSIRLQGMLVPDNLSRGHATEERQMKRIMHKRSAIALVVSIDGLVINARCDARGEPVIYAFSSADADLFGRVFDGYGRLSSIKQSSFVKGNPGVLLSVNKVDFDASGNVLYETYRGAVSFSCGAVRGAGTATARRVRRPRSPHRPPRRRP